VVKCSRGSVDLSKLSCSPPRVCQEGLVCSLVLKRSRDKIGLFLSMSCRPVLEGRSVADQLVSEC